MSGFDTLLQFQAIQQAASDNPDQRAMALNTLTVASMMQAMENEAAEAERRRAFEAERHKQERELRNRQELERKRQEAIAREQQFDALMEAGGGFASNNQYANAAHHYEEALQLFPNDTMANYNLAICWEKQGKVKKAYDKLLNLAGHSQKIDDFDLALTRCENALLELCNQELSEYYQIVSLNKLTDAKAHLQKIQYLAPKRTEAGQALLVDAGKKLSALEWRNKERQVMHKYAEGLQGLQAGNYRLALSSFENCNDEFKKYAEFLSGQQLEAYKNLPLSLSDAQRGVEQLDNINRQSEINGLLSTLREATANFDYQLAFETCSRMLQICREITNPQDVEHDYISETVLSNDCNTLSKLSQEFEMRYRDMPIQYARQIVQDLFARSEFALPEYYQNTIMNAIAAQLHDHWLQLDNRDLKSLIALINQEIPKHIGENNFLIACCAGKHFLQDQEQFTADIKAIIANNIPVDNRASVQLELFATKLQMQSVTMSFNSSIVIAEVVAPPQQLDQEQSRGRSYSNSKSTITS